MPELVVGSPGNAGDNQSGVGAVMFDRTIDPLALHLQNLKSFDDAYVKRKADQQKQLDLNFKMLSDLSPDVKGIMDSDLNYFQDRAAKLQEFDISALKQGANPNNPAFRDAYNQKRNLAQSIELDAQASKAQKEMLFKYMQEVSANPDKYDLEKTNRNVANFRASPFDMRKNFDISKMLVPKQSSLLELSKTKVLKDVPLDETSQTVVDKTSGGFQVESTKNYTPQHINGLAQAGYLGDNDVALAVNTDYEKLDGNKQVSYAQQAITESKAAGRTVAPQEVFYREYLKGISPNQNSKSGISYTPWQHAAANHAYDDQDDAQFVKYIAEAVKNAQGDDDSFWSTTVTEEIDNSTPTSINMRKGPVKYSQALNTLQLGRAVIPMQAKDPITGEPVWADEAKTQPVIEKYDDIPNRVLNMKKENGKAYLQTDESLVKQMQGDKGATGWEEITDRTIDKLVLGSKNPIKAAAILRKTLLDMNAYPGTNVNLGGGAKKEKISW